METRTAAVRAELEAHRAQLLARIAEFAASNPADVANLDFGKRIGDGTTYAVERMNGAYQARTLYETVSEIEGALERLDAGTFGVCTACGSAIPEGRLAALPWAALCIPCASRRPRSGQLTGR